MANLSVYFFTCVLVCTISLGATWSHIEHFLYPLHYEATIVAASRSAKVSPYLVAGVILAESSFDIEAQSEVGAQGLMQLMPDTAWWLAEAHSIRVDDRSNSRLREPELNIYLGAYYLSWLLERFDNKNIEALAAYNAGQHEVDFWIEKRGGPLTVDDIPVSETRFFVKKVLNNAEKYSKLYPQLAFQSPHDISRVEENGKKAK
ncbi:MAG: lytic transglycosylase domain-containing protein [Candidatus Bruticola sp.]